jgi:hypothetical protein
MSWNEIYGGAQKTASQNIRFLSADGNGQIETEGLKMKLRSTLPRGGRPVWRQSSSVANRPYWRFILFVCTSLVYQQKPQNRSCTSRKFGLFKFLFFPYDFQWNPQFDCRRSVRLMSILICSGPFLLDIPSSLSLPCWCINSDPKIVLVHHVI